MEELDIFKSVAKHLAKENMLCFIFWVNLLVPG